MNQAPINAQDHQGSDKELLKVLLELLYCQLVCFLVVWLALFAPMYCQYHGLMMTFGNMNQNDAMDMMQPEVGLHFHQMASSVTMVMSLFVATIPEILLLHSPMNANWLRIPTSEKPAEPSLPGPDEPPRLA